MSTNDPRTPELPDDDGVDAELAATLRRSLHVAGDAIEPTGTWSGVADQLGERGRRPTWATAPRVLVAAAAVAALVAGAVGVLDGAEDEVIVDIGADPTAPAADGRRSIVAVTDERVVRIDSATGAVDSSWSMPIPQDGVGLVGTSMTASPTPPWSLGTGIEEEAVGPVVAISTEGKLDCESTVTQIASDGSTSTMTRATAGTYSPDGARLAFLALEDPLDVADPAKCPATIVVVDGAAGATRRPVDTIRVPPPAAIGGPVNHLLWAQDGEHLAYNTYWPSTELGPLTTVPRLLNTSTGVETDLTPDPSDVPDDVIEGPDSGWEVIGVQDADTYWLRGTCFFECANVHWILAVDGDDVTAIERDPAEQASSVDPASERLLYATATEIECVEAPCDPLMTWHVAPSVSSDESTVLEDVVVAAWGPPLATDDEVPPTSAPHPTPGDGPPGTDTTWAPSPAAIDGCVAMIDASGAVVPDELADLPPAQVCAQLLALSGDGPIIAPVGPCPPDGMALDVGLSAIGTLSKPDLPSPVLATRFAIFQAAAECDWDALEALMADDFTWSFGDEPGAASARSALADLQAAADAAGEPGPLQLIVGLLSLDPWDRDGAWTWPAEMGWNTSAFVEGNPGLDQLAAVIGDEGIAQLIDLQTYLGWRLVILEDGTWNAFVAGD